MRVDGTADDDGSRESRTNATPKSPGAHQLSTPLIIEVSLGCGNSLSFHVRPYKTPTLKTDLALGALAHSGKAPNRRRFVFVHLEHRIQLGDLQQVFHALG